VGTEEIEKWMQRARDLAAEGLYWSQANGIAWLEQRISLWPEGWGDDLQILVFGDFSPPEGILEIPSLGIAVFPEKQENTVIRNAMCVLKATVKIREKTVSALIEAGRRINVFLGAYTLVEWGNAGCGWWSWVTHGTGGGVGTKLAHDDLPRAVDGILRLRPDIRQKVEAALYWVREPRNLLMEFYRNDVLRLYSSYWNAFECLVEAVIAIRPMPKSDRKSKQELLDGFISERKGRLTLRDVQDCYQQIVNLGFVGKAAHALQVCFGAEASQYVDECFRLPDKKNRLYDIRNAINHGAIDAEHPEELLRVESRLRRLWMINWRIFGLLTPFPAPLDSNLQPPSP
jgi:hypothetical protein